MKKLFNALSVLALSALVMMVGCKKNEDTPAPEDCATSTFPSTSGTAKIKFLNFTSDPDGDSIIDVNAAAGDYLSIAVQITKGSNRPQKLRVYSTECKNQKGDAVNFSGQPKTEDNGNTIDLANTDDPQLRTLVYQVPTGHASLYLNFEVDESNSKFSYKRIKLNISGSGIVDSYSNITLGGNTNANASRLSASTGQTFTSCQTAANIQYIDITYGNSLSNGNSYLTSNPARFSDFTNSPIGSTATTATKDGTTPCGDEAASEYSVRGGHATYFKVHTANDFSTIDNAGLAALTVSSADNQYVQVTTTPQVFEFYTADGRKGLIRVNSGTLNDPTASINVDVKVQR